GDEAVVVGRPGLQARDRGRLAHGPCPGAGALGGRLRAVARAGAVLEVPVRREPVGVDGALQLRRGERGRRHGAGDGRRRGGGRHGRGGGAAGAGVARREGGEVEGLAGGGAGGGRDDGARGRARARALGGRLRAVVRACSVLEVPGRLAPVRVHRAGERR